MKKIFYSVILLAAISCKQQNTTKEADPINQAAIDHKSTSIPLDTAKEQDIFFSQVFSHARFVPLETKTESYVADIGNIISYNGLYFLYDDIQKIILCFDASGKFRFKITPMGKGPLELNKITDFTINTKDQTVDVYDMTTRKIVHFDLEGNPQDETMFNFYGREISCNANGDYVVYSPDIVNQYQEKIINPGAFVISSDGHYMANAFKIPPSKETPYMPIDCLSGFGDSILLSSNYNKQVYLFNNEKISVIFDLQYAGDWVKNHLLIRAHGRLANLVYKKEQTENESSIVLMDYQNQKRLHVRYMFNNMFVLPVVAPSMYKDANTMVSIATAKDFRTTEQRYKARGTDQDLNVPLTKEAISLSKQLKDNDNPVLIELTWKGGDKL